MIYLDDAKNLLIGTDNLFCKNMICKNYNNCVRAVNNYKFLQNERYGLFIFDKTNLYYKEVEKCNNFIQKVYENETKSTSKKSSKKSK